MQTFSLGTGLSINLLDLMAFLWFCIAWLGYAELAKRASGRRKNLITLMTGYRLDWMRSMLRRENRITDMTAIANLVRSISFFASTSIILQVGFFSMLGYRDHAQAIIGSVPYAMPSSPFMST